jgi:sec-independent protein translocase protein TatA
MKPPEAGEEPKDQIQQTAAASTEKTVDVHAKDINK